MIEIIRIDDRLIHAQVVIGWGGEIDPDRYLVADDEVAGDEFERELYRDAVPHDKMVSILTVVDACEQIMGGVFDKEKLVVLIKSPAEALRMHDLGLEFDEINVGGMHFHEGKKKLLDNVYLDEKDRNELRELVKRGITLEARALPGSTRVIINSMVV